MKNLMEFIKKIYDKFIKMDKRKKIYAIAIITFILVMVWAFMSALVITSNFNRAQIKNSEDEQKVDALGIIITETKDGNKYFEIYGETGHYSNDHSIATLHNVIGNFYKDNEVSMSFQSSKGTYDENSGVITLYDNTYIVLKDGVSLKANKLVWAGGEKETIAEGNIIIQKGGEMKSTAEKCIIGANYDKFKITGKTTTKVYKKG